MGEMDRELTVEELEEVAGGAEEGINLYCPKTNKEACNTDCSPEVATEAAT